MKGVLGDTEEEEELLWVEGVLGDTEEEEELLWVKGVQRRRSFCG